MTTQKKGISVRFTDKELDRLETLADRYNVPMTQIIRWAITALDDYATANDKKLTLPVDFTSVFRQQRNHSVVAESSPGEES